MKTSDLKSTQRGPGTGLKQPYQTINTTLFGKGESKLFPTMVGFKIHCPVHQIIGCIVLPK
jgi:hypothetical protein